MLPLVFDRWAVWLGAAAAAGAATLWLAQRWGIESGHQGRAELLGTSFEAYLKDKEVVKQQALAKQFASTAFEAYLRQPATGVAPASDGGGANSGAAAADAAPPTAKLVIVLYGTEYGFGKEVAERACEALRDAEGGAVYWPQLLNMADLPGGLPTLAACQALLVVCSTQGDGVPPTEAREFCDWMASGAVPQLGGAIHFSVCALGDRSYRNFCLCGRMLDARLEALGASRLAPRVDVHREDFAAIDSWVESVLDALGTLPLKTVAELGGASAVAAPAAEGIGVATAKWWGKSRPYRGRVVAVEGLCNLTSTEDKNTVRVEVDLGDSGLHYLPGDALGVWPSNCPQAVEELLGVLGAEGRLLVQAPGWHYADPLLPEGATSIPLRDALTRCYDLRLPKLDLLQLLHTQLEAAVRQEQPATNGDGIANGRAAAPAGGGRKGRKGKGTRSGEHVKDKDSANDLSGGGAAAATGAAMHVDLCLQGCVVDRLEQLAALVADAAAAEAYLAPRHVVDVLRDFLPPARMSAADLLGTLRQLQPRLYSISSSQLEHPRRVQATVAIVRYESLGAGRLGVCSTFVGERLTPGQEVPVYIHKNPDFRLPADPATPIIMVGPGTGLAPFRSFMLDRILQAQGSGAAFGPCLLYFGCRRRDQDFLYGTLLKGWADQGKLTLYTAFSREQTQKVYVQDRLAESGKQVWALLEAGAHFYVCGDAGSMAGAVEHQLLRIIEAGQGQGSAAAEAYLACLSDSQRYQRDVWLS